MTKRSNNKEITLSGAWLGGERTSQDVKIWQSNEYSEHFALESLLKDSEGVAFYVVEF